MSNKLLYFTPGASSCSITNNLDANDIKDITGPVDISAITATELLISKPGFSFQVNTAEIGAINGENPEAAIGDLITQLRAVFPNPGATGGSSTVKRFFAKLIITEPDDLTEDTTVEGEIYRITSNDNETDFTVIGADDNSVNVYFIRNANGSIVNFNGAVLMHVPKIKMQVIEDTTGEDISVQWHSPNDDPNSISQSMCHIVGITAGFNHKIHIKERSEYNHQTKKTIIKELDFQGEPHIAISYYSSGSYFSLDPTNLPSNRYPLMDPPDEVNNENYSIYIEFEISETDGTEV